MAYLDENGNTIPEAPQRKLSEDMSIDQIRMLEARGLDPRQQDIVPVDVGEISPILGTAAGNASGGMHFIPSELDSDALQFATSIPRRVTGAAAALVPAAGGAMAGGADALWNAGMRRAGMGDDVPWYDRIWQGGADAWKRAYVGREEGLMGAVTDPVNVISMLAPPLAETRVVGQLGAAAADALKASRMPTFAEYGVPLAKTLARGLEGAAYATIPNAVRGRITPASMPDQAASGFGNGLKDAAIGAGMNMTITPLATKAALHMFPGIERMQDFSHGFAGRQKTSMTNIQASEDDLLNLIDQARFPTRKSLYAADERNLNRASDAYEQAFESVAPEHRAVSLDKLRNIPAAIRQDLEEKAALGVIPGDPATLTTALNHKLESYNQALENAINARGRRVEEFLPENQGLAGRAREYSRETDALLADLADPYLSLREVHALRNRFKGHYGPGSTETAAKQMDELVNSHLNEALLDAPGYRQKLGTAPNDYRTALQLGRLLNYNKIGAENSYFAPIMLRKLGTPGGISGLPFATMRSGLPAATTGSDEP